MELLRDWFRELPLSGVPADQSSASNSGVRVAVVQFSGQDLMQSVAKATPGGTGTGGALSGDLSQLESDVDWHEDNYLGKGTMIANGLEKAYALFKQSPSDGRKRVLLVIGDGKLMDGTSLAPVRADLEKALVETFAVGLRKFDQASTTDNQASSSLQGITTAPQAAHFVSLTLDNLYGQVLSRICDANGGFGAFIADKKGDHNPCPQYIEKPTCVVDSQCTWIDSTVSCVDSPCLHHCDQTDCVADIDNLCVWNATENECVRDVPEGCEVYTGDVDGCTNLDECIVDVDNTTCVDKPCHRKTEASCLADADDCVWKNVDATCGLRECSYVNESQCATDSLCRWESAAEAVATTTGEEAAAYSKGQPMQPFKLHSCTMSGCGSTACSTEISGAVVSIDEGYITGKDVLECSACAALGVATEWQAKSGILYLSPMGGAAGKPTLEFAQAIALVTFTTISESGATRKLGWNYGPGSYSSATGSSYRYFACSSCTWLEAKAKCEGLTSVDGNPGHLLTVSDSVENEVARAKLAGDAWIGATGSSSVLSSWKWQTGQAMDSDSWMTGEPSNTALAAAYLRWPTVEWMSMDPSGTLATGYACEWDSDSCSNVHGSMTAVSGSCQVERCLEIAQSECVADAYCEWTTNGTDPCVQKPCTEIMTEISCDHKKGCQWMASISPAMCVQEPCSKLTDQPTCDVDGDCRWDPSQDIMCVPKLCNDLIKCDCVKDPDCFWKLDSNPATGTCRDVHFGQCPTLDVVVLFDGSSSMSNQFGNHPHGFYAMIEMLRTWLTTLPLSGEPASMGKNSVASEKVRVALVQFSGRLQFFNTITNSFYGPVVNSVATAPVGVGTAGRLSGALDQLSADLTWHENNFLEGGTFIEKGLTTSGTIFTAQSPPDGRKRVLLIVTDGMIQDPDSLAKARGVLDGQQVQTFGVVVRRFTAPTATDIDAEKTLKPVVSTPTDLHFMNVQLENFVEKILSGICDPNGAWGALIVGESGSGVQGHKPCKDYKDKAPCAHDAGCAWSDALTACLDSPCISHCEEPECSEDTANYCAWNETVRQCFSSEKCAYTVAPDCDNDDGCQWVAVNMTCEEKPCLYPDEDSCIADKTFDCEWSSIDNKCSEIPCKATDKTTCTNDDDCEWDSHCVDEVDGACALTPCAYSDETECKRDAMCEWSGSCTRKTCTEYREETCCNAQDGCHWDVAQSPAMCSQEPCRLFADEPTCKDERDCMWSSDTCVEKVCDKNSHNRCACESDSDCYWVEEKSGETHCTFQRYGTCPTLDVVLLLDGGSSMSRTFKGHAHGFYALLEVVRDWSASLPLSKELAGAATKAGTSSVRLGLVQFAGSSQWPASDAKQILTPPASATGTSAGRLTGDLLEIAADLDYHQANFMGGSASRQPLPHTTYLVAGLSKASSMFKASPFDGRRRVLIVISDGALDDNDKYTSAMSDLGQQQVEVYGIALRPLTVKSPADEKAEADLKSYVASQPDTEHVKALTMGDLRATLDALCDANDGWGKFIANMTDTSRQPCASHTTKDMCNKDSGCIYFDSSLSCGASSCLQHCEEQKCVGDTANLCVWSSGACEKEEVCQYTEPARCAADEKCEVVDGTCTGKKCKHENEQGCRSDPDLCQWNALDQTCAVGVCKWDNADECELDTSVPCMWIDELVRCEPKKCLYGTEDDCTNKEPGTCEWDTTQTTPECVTAPCKQYTDEKDCNKDAECAWNTECEVVYCARYGDQGPCDGDGKCMWSSSGNEAKCVDKVCEAFSADTCRCHQDVDCFWDKGTCKTASYGECPTLDIVVAIDGSASMRRAFGLHPHGFEGVMEVVKAWVRTLTLTGESAGEVNAASAVGKVRVGIVQFSGKPAIKIPGTSIVDGAQKSPTGTGTGGRLSGNQSEVISDLDWQESNFMEGGTYIRAALDIAVDMFAASPSSRKKVLLVLTDGQVQDADNLAPARGPLETAGVVTFGIVVRQFDTNTKEDLDAEATLKQLCSAPQAEHYYNVQMHEIEGILSGLCDPNSMWGKFIVDTQQAGVHKPCGNYIEKEMCAADPGCVYEEGLAACVDTACIKHCEKEACSQDTLNICEWDDTDNVCYKGKAFSQ
ncbi:hypothetical protein DIPPA_05526 [Diplonema papillatum]|nr:hypothetical protein DIPPA_05526 [Diplonema papillatum]